MSNALEIAKIALRDCYDKKGIIAGKLHYKDYWARDSFYASWGALELGDREIVKKNLELFFRYIKNGQIPLRIGCSFFGQFLQMFGIKPGFGVQYKEDKGFDEAIDPNLLFLITLEKYVRATGDLKLAKKHTRKIKNAISWLKRRERNGLIYSGKYATWQDSVKKRGFVLYTNILYYEAMKKMGRLFSKLKIKNKFTEKSETLKRLINTKFWDKDKGFYIDYFREKKRSRVFASDGNFYSIIFDIADKKKRMLILRKAEEFGISKDIPSYTNFPKHKNLDIFLLLYLVNMSDYNDYGISWPWIGCIHAVALMKNGEINRSKKILDKISKIMQRDKDVYETYEKSGKPVNRLFYKSEHPFAWGASFYVLAIKQMKEYRRI